MTPTRLPIPLYLTYLVALASLIWVGYGPPALALFGLMALATLVFRQRIEQSMVEWGLRAITYLLAFTLAMVNGSPVNNWIFDSTRILLAGSLAAAEVAVQCWKPAPNRSVLVCLCGIVMFAACNANAGYYALCCSVLFFACLAPTLSYLNASTRSASRLILLSRVGALAGGVMLGAFLIHLFNVCNGVSLYSINISLQGISLPHSDTVGGGATSVQLTRTSNLQFSSARALRLHSYIGDGHLRGMSFTNYHLGQWTRPDLQAIEPVQATNLHPDAYGHLMRVDVLATSDHLLYLPLETAGVRTEARVSWIPEIGDPLQALWGDHPWYLAVRTHAPEVNLSPAPTPAQYSALLEVPPEINPRVRRLAARFIAQTASPREKITAVIDYLQQHHHYSTSIDPGQGDPTSNFLLRGLDGHCTYFASGATMLLRCLGVPTRFVSGYYAHERGAYDTTIVRQGDAHAWAESWVEGTGWVTVDATPASGMPETKSSWVQRTWEWLADIFAGARDQLVAFVVRQWPFLLGMLVAGYLIVLTRSLRRQRAKAGSSSGTREVDPAVAALATRFTRWLAKSGTPCTPDRPWHDHLHTFTAPPAAHAFVQCYNAVRFGAKLNEQALAEMGQLMKQLEAEPGARSPSPPGPLSQG